MITETAIDQAARKLAGAIPDARNTIAIERWVAHYDAFKAGAEWTIRQFQDIEIKKRKQ